MPLAWACHKSIAAGADWAYFWPKNGLGSFFVAITPLKLVCGIRRSTWVSCKVSVQCDGVHIVCEHHATAESQSCCGETVGSVQWISAWDLQFATAIRSQFSLTVLAVPSLRSSSLLCEDSHSRRSTFQGLPSRRSRTCHHWYGYCMPREFVLFIYLFLKIWVAF